MISRLKFPDAIRTHTSLFFSYGTYTELQNAFMQMVGLFSEEAAEGYSKEINIKISKDSSIEIYSKNRGVYLGSKADGDKAEWINVFCNMYPEYDDKSNDDGTDEYKLVISDIYTKKSYFAKRDEPYVGMHLHACNRFESILCHNQAVCEFMDVEVVRDGYERKLKFERGYNIGGLSETESDANNYTRIRFKYDNEVFDNIDIHYDFVKEQLHRLAVLNAGVTFNLVYETDDATINDTFLYPNGIKEYIEQILEGHEHTEIFEGCCTHTGKDHVRMPEYTAKLQVMFAFCKDKSIINTFHNYSLLSWDGEHTDEVIRVIQRVLNFMHRGSELTKREIKDHLVLMVVSNTSRAYSRWNDEGCRSLGNDMLVEMVSEAIDEKFKDKAYHKDGLIDTPSSWIYKERQEHLFKNTDDYKLQFENAITDVRNDDQKSLLVKCLLDMPRTEEYYDFLIEHYNRPSCAEEPLYYVALLNDYFAFITSKDFEKLKSQYLIHVGEYLPRAFTICEQKINSKT